MSTLLQRARTFIANKPAALGALVIVPLAAASQKAEAVFALYPYTFNSGTVQVHSLSSGDFPHAGTLGSIPGNPVKLITDAPITVTASQYSNGGSQTVFRMKWQGLMDASWFPVNSSDITIHYDFIVDLAGTNKGSVNWFLQNSIGGKTINVSSVSPLTASSTEVIGDISLPVTSALTNTWSTTLDLQWSGYTGDGVMTVSVPSSSIDLGVAVVPEPASLSVLALGAVGLLARRRWRE